MNNALSALLRRRIQSNGPIGIDEFMALALGHPQFGYYATRDPLGAAGDFTTAPEISQMFGELIGLWAAVVWRQMGAPPRLVLAELGPGRGTLMADLLRAGSAMPGFAAALDIHLVETSRPLRDRQAKALEGQKVTWLDRIEDLPDGPLLVVANEFFDALPIRQFRFQAGRWHERRVGLAASGRGLAFADGPESAPPGAPPGEEGAIFEDSPTTVRIAHWLGSRLARDGGAALIVDYGHVRSGLGETLQAVCKHRFHPLLKAPGSADLTAHVDFEALARAAMPARAWGPLGQGEFLRRLGIETRAAMLATPEAELALRRLIDPAEMGTLFKVLALAHPAFAPLPAL